MPFRAYSSITEIIKSFETRHNYEENYIRISRLILMKQFNDKKYLIKFINLYSLVKNSKSLKHATFSVSIDSSFDQSDICKALKFLSYFWIISIRAARTYLLLRIA